MEQANRDNDEVTTPTEPPRRALPRPNVTEGRTAWPTGGGSRSVARGSALYVIVYVMKTMSVTELRAGIADALDAVENDAEELVITRSGHEPMVVVSLAEYEALKETDYLLRSPAMAERLRRSIEQDRAGQGALRELVDPDDEAGRGAA